MSQEFRQLYKDSVPLHVATVAKRKPTQYTNDSFFVLNKFKLVLSKEGYQKLRTLKSLAHFSSRLYLVNFLHGPEYLKKCFSNLKFFIAT
jgi:hypothetical protein